MKVRITKKEFYRWGGFSNSDLIRKATKSGVWTYWKVVDNRESLASV